MKGKLVRDASVAFQQRDYEGCLKIIEQDIDLSSGEASKEDFELDIKIMTMIGLCHYNVAIAEKKKEFGNALVHFNKVIARYREYEKVIHHGDVESVMKSTEGLTVLVSIVKVYYLAGLCQEQQQNKTQAIESLSRAIVLTTTMQRSLGKISNKNLVKSTLQDLPKFYLKRGVCYNDGKNIPLAERDLLKAVALVETSGMSLQNQAPLLFMALTNLATTRQNKNHVNESIKNLNNGIEQYNTMEEDLKKVHLENFVKAKLKRAAILEQYVSSKIYDCKNNETLLKQIEEYRSVVSEDLETASKHKTLNFSHIYQYIKMILSFCKNLEGTIQQEQLIPIYKDAISKLGECIKMQPENATLYGDLALCEGKIGEKLESILDLYNTSIALTNDLSDKVSKQKLAKIHFERAVVQNKLSNKDKAREDLDMAIHLNPYFSDAYYNRGFLLKDTDEEQALDDLGATCELNLEDTECVILTGVLLAKLGNKEGAQSILEEFINFNPRDSRLQELVTCLDDNDKLLEFESIPKFRESHKKTILWTPKRSKKQSVDQASGSSKASSKKAPVEEEEEEEEDYDDGLYRELSFPAVQASIYGQGYNNLPEDLIWCRPWDLWREDEVQLFVDGSSYTDIMQGSLGDCWLVGAFTIVADYPDLMSKIIIESKCDRDTGKYTFALFKEGEFKEIVVDDRIPCYSDTQNLAFAKSNTRGELWIPLLEKAFASLYGSYDALGPGRCGEALADLTGGVSFSVGLTPDYKERVWDYLMTLPNQAGEDSSLYRLMGCRTSKATAKSGIQNRHVYGILDAFDIPEEMCNGKRIRLVKIKNPWGYSGEWKGDYSDGSKAWTKEIKEFVGHEDNGELDGVFFITLESFTKYFDRMDGVTIFNKNEWTEYCVVDEFKIKPHDIEDKEKDFCGYSSQYIIQNTHEDNSIVIALGQKDARFIDDERDSYRPMAIHIYNYPEEQFNGEESTRITKLGEVVFEGTYAYERDVTCQYTLPVGTFVVIPNELYSEIPSDKVTLRIISKNPMKIIRLPAN